jgi:hypothetical protein
MKKCATWRIRRFRKVSNRLCLRPSSFDGNLKTSSKEKIISCVIGQRRPTRGCRPAPLLLPCVEGGTTSALLCLSLGAGAYGLNLVPGPSAMIILDVW